MKESIKEFVGGVLFIVTVVFLAWAYCKVTPNQMSGEADLFAAELAAKEGGAK